MAGEPSHWASHSARWALLGPPLRPPAAAVDAIARQLAGHAGPTLLLGVTPELAPIADDLTAVERSAAMIDAVWPGDEGRRRAVLGNWQDLASIGGRYVAAVGDGSLNSLPMAAYTVVFAQLAGVLELGARIAIRTFVRPAEPAPLASVGERVATGPVGGFHAHKWRIAMAVAGEAGRADIAVAEILAAFEALHPDRDALVAATGWDRAVVDTIDGYRGSAEVYSFPTAGQLLAAVPAPFVDPRLVPSGEYELADCCPLLVADVDAQ